MASGLVPPDGNLAECSMERLWTFIENERIDCPPLSEDELQARGKSDLSNSALPNHST